MAMADSAKPVSGPDTSKAVGVLTLLIGAVAMAFQFLMLIFAGSYPCARDRWDQVAKVNRPGSHRDSGRFTQSSGVGVGSSCSW